MDGLVKRLLAVVRVVAWTRVVVVVEMEKNE